MQYVKNMNAFHPSRVNTKYWRHPNWVKKSIFQKVDSLIQNCVKLDFSIENVRNFDMANNCVILFF